MSAWKPGDVAMLTIYGTEHVGFKTLGGWVNASSSRCGDLADATERRPLAVIDPESDDDVRRLADAFCNARWSHIEGSEECDPLTRTSMQQALREFANPTPPKCGQYLVFTWAGSQSTDAEQHNVCAKDAGHDGPHLDIDSCVSWTAKP